MKNLKIRFGLFSLLAVLAVSVFLTSCEQEELVNQTPATNLLVSIEPTNENSEIQGFQDMIFSDKRVIVFPESGISVDVELNGELLVSSDGNIAGQVSTKTDDRAVDGIVTIENEIIRYETTEGSVELNLLSTEVDINITTKNGTVKKASLTESIDELVLNNYDKSNLSIEQQATIAYLAVFGNELWMANMHYAQSSINFRGCNYWQNAIAIAAGAAIVATLSSACAGITTGCAAGTLTPMTFVGVTLACPQLLALCAGGIFAGGAAVMAMVRGLLCGGETSQPQPCRNPNWVAATGASGRRVNLSWEDSSADLYWIYMRNWNNGGWDYIGSAPRGYSAAAISNVSSGHQCFAVEGVCGSSGQLINQYSCTHVPN